MTEPVEPEDGSTRTSEVYTVADARIDTDVPGQRVEPFTFPAVARLELDELLEQLIGRATEVLGTQGRLRGLLRATQAVATDLDLPSLLQRIVEEARVLIGARYAALGVIGDDQALAQFVHSGMDPEVVARIGHLPTGQGILGLLIRDPRPLRLQRLSEHDASVGFPDGHPPMGSFLGVPVRIRGQVFGNLYLTEKTGGEQFSAEDEELALALAAAAAAAIDNARLFDMVARREHWLDVSRTMTNELLNVRDRDQALGLITRATRDAAGADFAAVVAPDGAGSLAVAAADGPLAPRCLGAPIPTESPTSRAIRERGPVVLADLSAHDELHGPIKDLGLGPLAVVPLSARNQVLGSLAIGNLPGGRLFTAHDVQMATDFATQAALVLLDAAAQSAARELELSEERARIARDLHDNAIQAIFAVGLGLNGQAVRIGGQTGARIMEQVDQLDEAIKAIRRSIFTLQPTQPGQPQRLRTRLEHVLDDATPALGFRPALHTEGPVDSAITDDIAHDLLAVLREALSNTARHANANTVSVRVAVGERITLEVHDDGHGIGTPTRNSGLANMATRATRHGGHCEITDTTAGGTTVHWAVPLSLPPKSRAQQP
jgi:signal transduction histidine kinase